MSDDAERRERKTFEPPPWERDQFEELARLKAGEQERQAAEEAAWRGSVLAAARLDANAAQPGETEIAGGPREDTASAPAEKPKPAVIEDAKVQAMLLELSGEEHSAVHEVRRAGVVAAGILATAGSIMLGLGIVLLIRGGEQGFAGAGTIVAVGMFVIGFAVWLGYRAGRGQGS